MKFQILHESPGRVRLRTVRPFMSMEQADLLEAYLTAELRSQAEDVKGKAKVEEGARPRQPCRQNFFPERRVRQHEDTRRWED